MRLMVRRLLKRPRSRWFRGCSTIPRGHTFLSASRPCRNTIPRERSATFWRTVCRSDHHGDWFRLLSPLLRLLELGRGDIAAKTGILLEAATRLRKRSNLLSG